MTAKKCPNLLVSFKLEQLCPVDFPNASALQSASMFVKRKIHDNFDHNNDLFKSN